jgi:predicted O-methyltransferase YrrM
MDQSLQALLEELYEFGRTNDAATSDRPHKMLNITPDTGEFLELLVNAINARRILEIGTSNGYSTLWLANAARATGGRVTTVELSDYKADLAGANFLRSGLGLFIELVHKDAGEYLSRPSLGSFDLVFLDSERDQYVGWWPSLKKAIRAGGLLVVDNALSHPLEVRDFIALVRSDSSFLTSLVPIGNGEFVALRVRI